MKKRKINFESFRTYKHTRRIDVREINSAGNEQSYLHWHPHYEVLVILKGKYTIVSNSITISSDKPAIFIHMPYSLHNLNSDFVSKYHRIILAIDRTVPRDFSDKTVDMSVCEDTNFVMVNPTPDEMQEICDMLHQIQRHYKDELTCELYTALVMHRISQIVAEGRGKRMRSSFTYVQDLLCYIGDNLAEPLTIDELAKRYNVSKTKLCSDFREVTGNTYKSYLTALRLTRARELLLGGMSIINTTFAVGYSSEAHFIAAFRKYYETTPGELVKGSMTDGH